MVAEEEAAAVKNDIYNLSVLDNLDSTGITFDRSKIQIHWNMQYKITLPVSVSFRERL